MARHLNLWQMIFFLKKTEKGKYIGALRQTETIFSASIESIIKNERGEGLHFVHAHIHSYFSLLSVFYPH